MVMDRLGGFRLCRRLLDTEERLPPFLSAEAMMGRGLEQRQEYSGVTVTKGLGILVLGEGA